MTDDLKTLLRYAAEFAERRGGQLPTLLRVELIKAGIFKTYDFFLGTLERLVRDVYGGFMGGEFVDIMANLIQGQITKAFQQAWQDEGTDDSFPDYLQSAADDMILGQYDHVDGFYRDIVDARVDGTPIAPLLTRCQLWANRYNEAYNTAVQIIVAQLGGNMVWKLGHTEQHCSTCSALNGIVARASEWDALGVHPQGAPNDLLECGGWHCGCSKEPTDKRRSPNAYSRIMDIVSK